MLRRSFTSGLFIRGAVAHSASEPFRMDRLALRPIQSKELLVRIAATGVCHTDIFVKSKALCQFPIVLGHEGAGVVEQVGKDVTGFSAGDRVVLSFASCGSCASCHQQQPGYCDKHGDLNFSGVGVDGDTTHVGEDGDSVFGSFFQQSSFATHAITSPTNAVKVSDDIPLSTLAPLGCGVQTGAGAVLNTLRVGADEGFVVFGAGSVGLSAVLAASLSSPGVCIAVDVTDSRLELAKELGATHTINVAELAKTVGDGSVAEAVANQIKDFTGGQGVRHALDTSGQTSAIDAAIAALAPRGTCAFVAPGPPGQTLSVELMSLLAGKSLRGVVQGDSVPQEMIPRMIELYKDGRFPFDKLITHYPSLDHINEAIHDTETGKVIKPVIHIDPTLCM